MWALPLRAPVSGFDRPPDGHATSTLPGVRHELSMGTETL